MRAASLFLMVTVSLLTSVVMVHARGTLTVVICAKDEEGQWTRPIEGARVECYRIDKNKNWILVGEGTTDKDGIVKFSGLKAHGYTLVVYLRGRVIDTHSVWGGNSHVELAIWAGELA